MTSYEKLLEDFEDEPDCGVDAASDKGFWLEKADKKSYEYLFAWRKKAGLSPELLPFNKALLTNILCLV